MSKTYKVVSVPEEPTRHHLGDFGLVQISEDLPSEICEVGFRAGLPYFAEALSVNATQATDPLLDEKEERKSAKK
jgi:hypothetical protein